MLKKSQVCSSKEKRVLLRCIYKCKERGRQTEGQRDGGTEGQELNWIVKESFCGGPFRHLESVPHIPVTYTLSGITDKVVIKSGGGSQITICSLRPRSPPPMAQSIWQEPAVSGSRCSTQALGVTSGLWELGEKLTRRSKTGEEILRGTAFPPL